MYTTENGFYSDSNSNAAKWVINNPNDYRSNEIKKYIVDQSAGKWFGNWNKDIYKAVNTYMNKAEKEKKVPILVAYNIPNRDCGQYSSGGEKTAESYKKWIESFAEGIGHRKAVIILEPDALPQTDCLKDKDSRFNLLKYAANQIKQKASVAYLYLDIGHSGWLSAQDAANRLIQADIAEARGFSLNVSHYRTTDENIIYGNKINEIIQEKIGEKKYFIIDTSRNGNGPLGSEWCDPTGRKLGVTSHENKENTQPEMFLWIKNPGNADGCAAPAGTFSPDIAYKLIHGY